MPNGSDYCDNFERKYKKSHDYLDQVERRIPEKQLFGLMHKDSKDELHNSTPMQKAQSSANKVEDDAEQWRRTGRMGNEEYQAFEHTRDQFRGRQTEVERKIDDRQDTTIDKAVDFWKRQLGGRLPGLPSGKEEK
jgi:hypothetical protein